MWHSSPEPLSPAGWPPPAAANRRPVARSDTPDRSRYGVIPPSQNGQPAPVIIARSMSCGIGDDALIEDQPGLLRQRLQGPLPHLLAGRRAIALLQHRNDLRGDDLLPLIVPTHQDLLAGLHDPAQVLRHREPVAERGVQPSPARAGRPPAR